MNPDLSKPANINLFEIDRIRVTRYRVGSHNLKIETGRMSNPVVPREDRLCSCRMDIQSLKHCVTNCPLLEVIYERYSLNPDQRVATTFTHPIIATILLEIEKVLKV